MASIARVGLHLGGAGPRARAEPTPAQARGSSRVRDDLVPMEPSLGPCGARARLDDDRPDPHRCRSMKRRIAQLANRRGRNPRTSTLPRLAWGMSSTLTRGSSVLRAVLCSPSKHTSRQRSRRLSLDVLCTRLPSRETPHPHECQQLKERDVVERRESSSTPLSVDRKRAPDSGIVKDAGSQRRTEEHSRTSRPRSVPAAIRVRRVTGSLQRGMFSIRRRLGSHVGGDGNGSCQRETDGLEK